MQLQFGIENELCMSNIWSMRKERKNVTFRIGKIRQKLTMLLRREHWWFLINAKPVPGEFQ